MKKLLSVLLLAASSLALAANEGYLVDTNNNIVKSGTGLCWHTGYWTPANAVEGCDPVGKAVPTAAKITMQAETLFDFDKATLKPEGKLALDKLVQSMKGYNTELVVAVGYTDRIGSDKYNKALSVRRAQAVQDYLVKLGVPHDKTWAEGKGKANPVTGDTCKGAVTNKLIACLAPDRRVVIEVIGTQAQ